MSAARQPGGASGGDPGARSLAERRIRRLRFAHRILVVCLRRAVRTAVRAEGAAVAGGVATGAAVLTQAPAGQAEARSTAVVRLAPVVPPLPEPVDAHGAVHQLHLARRGVVAKQVGRAARRAVDAAGLAVVSARGDAHRVHAHLDGRAGLHHLRLTAAAGAASLHHVTVAARSGRAHLAGRHRRAGAVGLARVGGSAGHARPRAALAAAEPVGADAGRALGVAAAELPHPLLAIAVSRGAPRGAEAVGGAARARRLGAVEGALARVPRRGADLVLVAGALGLLGGAARDWIAGLASLHDAVPALGRAVGVVVVVAGRGAAPVAGHTGGLLAVVHTGGGAGARVHQLAELAAHRRATAGAGRQGIARLHPLLGAVVALDGAVAIGGGVAPRGAAAVVVNARRLHPGDDAGGGAGGGRALHGELRAPLVGAHARASPGRIALFTGLDHSVTAHRGLRPGVGGRRRVGGRSYVRTGFGTGSASLDRRTARPILW